MKMFSLTLASVVMMASASVAGTVSVAPEGTSPNGKYVFTLDPAGMEGAFDTVELVVTGPMAQDPAGGDGELIQESDTDSGFSAFLEAPPNFGGQGLSLFGIDATTDTETGISGTAASLGDNSASTMGAYTLAQVVSSTNGSFRYEFFDDGNSVGAGEGTWGFIPEPTSIMLAGLGMLGIAIRRRS